MGLEFLRVFLGLWSEEKRAIDWDSP